jgi:hypothetical protein
VDKQQQQKEHEQTEEKETNEQAINRFHIYPKICKCFSFLEWSQFLLFNGQQHKSHGNWLRLLQQQQ